MKIINTAEETVNILREIKSNSDSVFDFAKQAEKACLEIDSNTLSVLWLLSGEKPAQQQEPLK